jgi:hypothetical protein
MNWTEPQKAKEGVSWYDHVFLETPIGRAIIEWKRAKQSDSYSLTIGNDYVGEGYDLDEAKKLAHGYLKTKYNELGQLLS